MDLKQRKLTKSEWDSIEIPVSSQEIDILKLIVRGYSNINIKINKTDSIFTFLKLEYNAQIEEYLYIKFFADKIKSLVEKYEVHFIKFGNKKQRNENNNDDIHYINVDSIVKLRSTDQIRMARIDSENIINNSSIYETILYENLKKMVVYKAENNRKWHKYYYTLVKLLQNTVERVNNILTDIIRVFINKYETDIDLLYTIRNSSDIIEKNQNLLKYSDLTLYEHQKQIYTELKDNEHNVMPKLILYTAPTGTGKTLTPLGLSEGYKIIFVCAARHVGLALAKSAISIGKKIAFAFGCSAAEDVRLHYSAAKEYTKDKRSGKIKKVDNTVGDKVEIIICDIRSYLPAMFYMASFNSITSIVTYWDEPTITLDYEHHDLHAVIKKNWKENIIPNMVLSSATLPKMTELTHTIADFKQKFADAEIISIVSHDCRKSIPLINNNGYVIMPHYLSNDYEKIKEVVSHCENNLTLMRYFDLSEASEFIYYVETNKYNRGASKFERNFASINDIDMKSIKLHYLKVLKNINPTNWNAIYSYFAVSRVKRIKFNNTIDPKGRTMSLNVTSGVTNGAPIMRTNSVQQVAVADLDPPGSSGVYVTTKDAYTLTDGPTIFLANDLQKVAKFCIQQANIPAMVMNSIVEKIDYNNQINARIEEIERTLEFEENKLLQKIAVASNDNSKEAKKLQGKKDGKSKSKIANKIIDKTEDKRIAILREDIATLKSMVKNATIDDMFIPNTLSHLAKWANGLDTSRSFTSKIDEETILSIMLLNDVDNSWKILLLLGIGVFANHKSSSYTEIMKKLADNQQLYLIIADSDYIYGTNYQFCHGYLSKDLELTQSKIIQALGRIGRNNIQQDYSARFRDDSHVDILFSKIEGEDNPEVINMNQLFNSNNIKWNGVEYDELPNDELDLDVVFVDDDDDDNNDNDDNDYTNNTIQKQNDIVEVDVDEEN